MHTQGDLFELTQLGFSSIVTCSFTFELLSSDSVALDFPGAWSSSVSSTYVLVLPLSVDTSSIGPTFSQASFKVLGI